MPDAIAATSRTGGTYTATTVDPSARKQEMDGEAFMQLMITQLTNQDPSSPMDTNDMIAQTTQMAMMEALVGLQQDASQTLSLTQRQVAADHLGKSVDYIRDDGTAGSARVTAVTSEAAGGTSSLVLDDGSTIPISAVTRVNTDS